MHKLKSHHKPTKGGINTKPSSFLKKKKLQKQSKAFLSTKRKNSQSIKSKRPNKIFLSSSLSSSSSSPSSSSSSPSSSSLSSSSSSSLSQFSNIQNRMLSTISVPGQATYESRLTPEQKMQRVKELHDEPITPASFDPDPTKQFLKWFKDIASVDPIMPERMNASTIRKGPGPGGKDVFFPSSRPVLLKEIILGEDMISPYTLLAPPDVNSTPSTAASIQKKANKQKTSHFFPSSSSGKDSDKSSTSTPDITFTGTTIPFPYSITQSMFNSGGGFTFVCNYESDKSKQIESFENPTVGLTFHWVELERVVRIEGMIYRSPESLSQLYHSQRPRGSQVSAVASHQSQPVNSHEELVERYNKVDKLLKEGKYDQIDTLGINRQGKLPIKRPLNDKGEIDIEWVPKPDQWGAYIIIPERFEFWQGQPSRFHQRLLYTPKNGISVADSKEKVEWDLVLLQP